LAAIEGHCRIVVEWRCGQSVNEIGLLQGKTGKDDECQGYHYLADRWRCCRLACWPGGQRWWLRTDWQHHRRHCWRPDRRLAFTAYRRVNCLWRHWRDYQRLHRRSYPVGHFETDQTIRRISRPGPNVRFWG